ncbi:RNA-directed DNA methylation 4-like [Bidens hawaiensis]|uniref:RNA-directed DNA methylation 4-like n=1 Tax=Bidens hawaiensis TaxID=980011 RepID=UPI0040490D61
MSSSATADKPVIVRVKRKTYHSPLEAFWLEINERPVKRLLDFDKLSINDSASKAEELKPKKFFVQHVDTVSSSDVAVDILQSFVASKEPNSADALNSKAKVEDQRRSNKADTKQKQLLVKAKESQELFAKNARFKQIWKSRRGIDTAASDDALHDMCRLYDVERVDIGETSQVHRQEDEEELRLMRSFLPLLQEFIPSAAEEVESDIDYRMTKKASKDDYVYDLYAVKDDSVIMMEEDTSSPFPFVQVDDDDFYDGPDNSDYETDDSNAEDNPLNDYPDEEDDDEDEDGSESSEEHSEEEESGSSGSERVRDPDLSEDDDEDDADDYYDVLDDESHQ